ncbi:hypothetical protein [Streptomyces sp. I05A-00742]|uniref:hypothetical protein n=1 Tax=Streptomyces sp. I05A-00742 TaxID=2732853 RepID=UPI001BB166DB|nr:hypothetical protein [Streptomyces sp. I05A-00742]
MTGRVAQRRSSGVRKAARGAAVALTAGVVLAGTAWSAEAAPAVRTAPDRTDCGGFRAAAAPAVPAADRDQAPEVPPTAAGTRALSYSVASAQAPIGLWSKAGLTLRTPVTKGTARLDLSSRGFSTDSVAVQRYEPAKHAWVDLDTKPGGGSWPQRGTFTFPVSAPKASARNPYAVALRFQDLDRPGTLTVDASVADGRGHTYRAPSRTVTATRPKVAVTGWTGGTATLRRGGEARPFTITVRNTTNRSYPALNVNYFAYGAGKQHALTPKDLVLQQYRPGHGWEKVALTAGGCDPGMGASLRPARTAVAPGATVVYRLRLAVAASAPRDVVKADSGFSVSNGDQAFFSKRLPFTIRGK